MIDHGKRRTGPNRLFRTVSALFIPFLVFHLACVIPVVEWSCFCPEDDHHWDCCCNCAKCVERRGGFKSYCGVRPVHLNDAEHARVKAVEDLPRKRTENRLLKIRRVSFETLRCDCNGHIKNIVVDLKPFLPSITVDYRIPFPAVARITRDDQWPPDVIPCQREVPG